MSRIPVDQPPGRPASSPAVLGGVPNIPVVRLGNSFAPNTLQLGAGQKFVVIVNSSVKVSGAGMTGTCTPAEAKSFTSTVLSLSCEGSSYLYTTLRPGTTALAVSVRPACATGTVCPQWIARASLRITIT